MNTLEVPPPALNAGQQDQLKSAVLNPPGVAGIELSNWNWNWKVVRGNAHVLEIWPETSILPKPSFS